MFVVRYLVLRRLPYIGEMRRIARKNRHEIRRIAKKIDAFTIYNFYLFFAHSFHFGIFLGNSSHFNDLISTFLNHQITKNSPK